MERSGVLSKKMKRPPSLSLPRLDRDPVSVKITPPLIREGSHLDRGDFRPFCMASSAVCAAVSLSSENKEMSDERPKRGLGPLKNTEGVKAGELPYFYPFPFLPLLVCLSQQVSLSLPSPFTAIALAIFSAVDAFWVTFSCENPEAKSDLGIFPLLSKWRDLRNPHSLRVPLSDAMKESRESILESEGVRILELSDFHIVELICRLTDRASK